MKINDYTKYVFDKQKLLSENEKEMVAKLVAKDSFGAMILQTNLLGEFENKHSLIEAVVAKFDCEANTGETYADVLTKYLVAKGNLVIGEVIDEKIAKEAMDAHVAITTNTGLPLISDFFVQKRMFRLSLYDKPFNINAAKEEPANDKICGYCVFNNSQGILAASNCRIQYNQSDQTFNVVKNEKTVNDLEVFSIDGGRRDDKVTSSYINHEISIDRFNVSESEACSNNDGMSK